MRVQRFVTAWAVSVLTLAVFGAGLVGVAIVKGQFPLMGVHSQLRLVAAWAGVGALAGGVVGVGVGILAALLSRRVWRVGVCLAAMSAVVSGTVGLARVGEGTGGPSASNAIQYPPLPERLARPEAPNFVLISIDTLRADHLGLYGYARDTSPELDAFARGGVIFETAIAQAPATLRSMASLVTGLYPYVLENELEDRERRGPFVGSGFHTLAERLAASGYDTAGFVSNNRLLGSNGFSQGFSQWDDQSGMFGVGPEGRSKNAGHVIGPAIRWLDKAKSPFFLWVHLMDPHHPYEPSIRAAWEEPASEEFLEFERTYATLTIKECTDRLFRLMRNPETFTASELQFLMGRYDTEILQIDQHLSRLIAALRSRGYDDSNTVVGVVADHGEEFMDHGGLFHAATLYDELTRVPLIFRGPGIPSGRRVPQQVRLIDVVPTILELSGIDQAGLDGRSLASYFDRGEQRSRPALSVRSIKYVSYRTPTRKLIVAFDPYEKGEPLWRPLSDLESMARIAFGRKRRTKIGLWHLDQDPGEHQNRIEDSIGEAQDLYQTLLRHRSEHPPRKIRSEPEPGPPASVLENLRALGYVE